MVAGELVELPAEALAIIEYAERRGLLIAPSPSGDGDDDDVLNPDFLYTGAQLRDELRAGGNAFANADYHYRWRLVKPQDVLEKLLRDCEIARSQYEMAKSYLEQFRSEMAGIVPRAKEEM